MLTYDLEKRGELPRYDYLYRCIKGDILSGRLGPGERLPSKRALAAHLGTAVATVENAYAQLLAEGYLVSRQRAGYYVAQVESRAGGACPAEAGTCGAEAGPWGERRGGEAPPRPWLLDLRGSGGGIEGFPFSVWARLTRRVLSERGPALLRAVPHSGVPELREALARHLYELRGIRARPEQIVVGAGAEYLDNLLVQLLGRERGYGLEDPGYSRAWQVYALNGARCRSLPVDGQGVPPEAFEGTDLQVLHLSPNHQFPTGAVTPIPRRQAMLRWAGAGDRYLIEDDYDSEFRFSGRPIPPLQSIDQGGKVLYLNTFSRTLAPSLRIGYLVLPPALVGLYREKLGFYACTVPAIEQHTLALFLSEGYFESHLNRMRVFYRNRRDRVLEAVQDSPLAGRCRPLREEAGLHFLLELDTDVPDRELARRGEEAGLRLSFLTDYQRQEGSAPAHTLVVHYPALAPEGLGRGLEALARLLD